MELYRREQLKPFTMFQRVMSLAILQKKCLLFPRTRGDKEGRFQDRKVTAKMIVFRILCLQLKLLLKF